MSLCVSFLLNTAFCDEGNTLSVQGDYTWPKTNAEVTADLSCVYMGTGGGRECEIVEANATRYCNPYGVWEDPDTTKCYTQVTQAMCGIRNVSMFRHRQTLLHDIFSYVLCNKVDKKGSFTGFYLVY